MHNKRSNLHKIVNFSEIGNADALDSNPVEALNFFFWLKFAID